MSATRGCTDISLEEAIMKQDYEIAAYYFPDYHTDTRNDKWHGSGWTEWEVLKRAEPRFEGHQQPKVPMWGYEDESKPEVMEKKIAMASDHGITSFIFDWYWYDDGPYLQRCLEEGFLKASNNNRLNFSIMWANHDLVDIHPAQRSRPCNILKSGDISEKTFIEATNHIINKYFKQPNYLRVDGGLYFSIYELMNLVKGLGGIERTRTVIDEFRSRVRAEGLGEIHMNAVVWGIQILPSEEKITNANEMLKAIGFDSTTSYVWIHHHELKNFPETSYEEIGDLSVLDYEKFTEEYNIPYYPNVTMGWDASPRTIQSDAYDNLGYPFMATLSGNTPQAFEKYLVKVKEFLDKGYTNTKMFNINAWNEWTEGSYLEPDTVNGLGYLCAIKKVFKNNKNNT